MQRSDERDADYDDPAALLDDLNDDTGIDAAGRADSTSDASSGSRLRGLLPSGVGPSFSLRSFLVILVASVAGVVAGGAIPIVGSVGRFLGLLAVAFAAGLIGSRSRYLEVGLAGAVAAGTAFLLGTLTSIFAPVAVQFLADYGVAIVGVGVGTGFLVSIVGHYFGRDFRDGLTREV
ncbi:hypothetical protein GCM10008995_10430 [Halobellus salinus]|uniref:DUF456 domain-containing protein n=1 Tax=Halobellus salinus TaxID=931585 RepID=A0A830ENR1_9EURY|nr:hypothetical protein [Halobellus salinus]GGJ02575.1 hypothetical protein GCM10008995_10430 [Halobellus salinus]SMP16881.1 hypothetical protein SAMN06265347_10634 [Halobellus salinus]